MAWPLEIALDEDVGISKRLFGLSLCAPELVEKVVGPLDDLHALSAAALDGLDQDRIADLVGLGLQVAV